MIKQAWEIAVMRTAGGYLAEVIEVLREAVAPGATTLDLDALAEAEIAKRQSRPAFKGYRDYPNTVCASINHGVVHGIPNDKPLKKGDLVSLDFGLIYGGYYADSAFSIYIGTPGPDVERLLTGTQAALAMGIEMLLPGRTTGDVGAVIEKTLKIYNLGIIRDYSGHAIGRDLHEEPSFPNWGKPNEGPGLTAGMVVCIEPMTTLGKEKTRTLKDGWTVVTKDKSLSAHYEHMVALLPDGPQVLTTTQKTL